MLGSLLCLSGRSAQSAKFHVAVNMLSEDSVADIEAPRDAGAPETTKRSKVRQFTKP